MRNKKKLNACRAGTLLVHCNANGIWCYIKLSSHKMFTTYLNNVVLLTTGNWDSNKVVFWWCCHLWVLYPSRDSNFTDLYVFLLLFLHSFNDIPKIYFCTCVKLSFLFFYLSSAKRICAWMLSAKVQELTLGYFDLLAVDRLILFTIL